MNPSCLLSIFPHTPMRMWLEQEPFECGMRRTQTDKYCTSKCRHSFCHKLHTHTQTLTQNCLTWRWWRTTATDNKQKDRTLKKKVKVPIHLMDLILCFAVKYGVVLHQIGSYSNRDFSTRPTPGTKSHKVTQVYREWA